jgi:phosphate transport system protein
MDKLHGEILAQAATVEATIDRAVRALRERRLDLVQQVLRGDDDIDCREVQIEDECLKMLALHQPVAIDLRRIAAVLKINSDLERIADLAQNIAERTKCLIDFPTFSVPQKLGRMADTATMMVRSSLDCFVNMDARAARHVCELDDEVDRLNREIIQELCDAMRGDVNLITPAMHCFSASRHIERIADHATNIAEDVIYLVEGEIVRHKHDGVHLPRE